MTIIRNIIINNQSTLVKDVEARRVIAALQKQVSRDFAPLWKIDAKLEFSNNKNLNPNFEQIVLLDDADQANALGYHERTKDEIPLGFSFVRTTLKYGGAWSATTSHELLEQLSDPLVNMEVEGTYQGKPALFFFENCDPVENDEYVIDGVKVSNFVTPLWFLGDDPVPPPTSKFDFMRQLKAPFTMSKGGYMSFALGIGQWQQVFGIHLPAAQKIPERFSRRAKRMGTVRLAQMTMPIAAN